MSSIALFPCISTLDSGIIGVLSSISTLKVYTDENLFGDTVAQFGGNANRLRKMMYGRTSVFNHFTLEKEKVVNMFHIILADKLCGPEQYLFHGFLTSLIPLRQKEVLKVLVIDTRNNRIDRCIHDGLSKSEAKKNIYDHDISAFSWTDFLFKKKAYDSSLYDLLVPVKNRDHRQIAKEILSCFH
ncbi:MAG: cytidylate kinase-like family protein [Desulfobulbaceae bacterium]|nr:cytidylate kinase-like family protein [Desulfobulbaceae bacterium]